MDKQVFEIKTGIQIAKPAAEVYEAIADPDKMANYFIANGSGRLDGEKEVIWKFPEFDMEFSVKGVNAKPGKFISFEWEGAPGMQTVVEIALEPAKHGTGTVMFVYERGPENNEAGIKWLKSNSEGWANFSACLKAWLEYGINLRKGAFDFMRG